MFAPIHECSGPCVYLYDLYVHITSQEDAARPGLGGQGMRYLQGPTLACFVSKRESWGEGAWEFKAVAKAFCILNGPGGGGDGELGYAL